MNSLPDLLQVETPPHLSCLGWAALGFALVFCEVSCHAAIWSGLHFLEYMVFLHHQCLGFSLFLLSLYTSSASKHNGYNSISTPLQEVAPLWDPDHPTHNLIFDTIY